MLTRDTDTRAVSLVDLPVIRRLLDKGTVLDNELVFTRSDYSPNSSLISTVLLPQRGVYTLLSRSEKQQVVAQFRLKPDDSYARVVYVAPGRDYTADDTIWLHAFDAMAREAGRHGAHMLMAEVEENDALFETLRTSGYAVYARQEVWRRPVGDYACAEDSVELTTETFADATGVYSLFVNTVPSMVQPFAAPPADMHGLVYRRNDRTGAYLAYAEGKSGVYLIPYLHPDVMSETPAVMAAALQHIARADRVPVYVCVRRYQDWITEALAQLGFSHYVQQAVMVKHITAGVRSAGFASLRRQLDKVVQPVQSAQNTTVNCDEQ